MPELPAPREGSEWRLATADDRLIIEHLLARCCEAGWPDDDAVSQLLKSLDVAPTLLAVADDRAVGVAQSRPDFRMAASKRVFLAGAVDPASRGRRLGRELLAWSEQAGRELLAGETGVLRVDSFHPPEDATALYAALDFHEAMVELLMRRDLALPFEETPAPALIFESWEAADHDALFAVYENAFRDRPGFPNWTKENWLEAFTGEDDFFRADLSFLVRLDGEPVGFAICGVEAGTDAGHIAQLGVHPPHRRKGIGTAILREACARFRASGLAAAQLDVNTNNPGAIAAYEKASFVNIRRYVSYQKQA